MEDIRNPRVRHEPSDVNIRGIFGFGAAMLTAGLVIYFVVWLLFTFLASEAAVPGSAQYPLAANEQTRLPPEPRLQSIPREDMKQLRAEERRTLTSYRWVDRNRGVVRIPIDDAMRLTLERGLPTRQEGKEKQ